MKLEELPPPFQAMVKAMPPALQVIALDEKLSANDFMRLADYRLREAVATYGPHRILRAAADRLQEAFMWAATFDPETDKMPAPTPIITADPGVLEDLDKEFKSGKKGRK
jgi:hypothetical protein